MGFSVLILAGGAGRRLGGVDKPLVEVGETSILERQLAILRPRADRILLSTNNPEPYARFELETVEDRIPGAGPLAGLEAGLALFDSERTLVLAGDLPFLNADFLEFLWAWDEKVDAIVPRIDRPHPLHAVYRTALHATIGELLDEGKRTMRALLDRVETDYPTPDDFCHIPGAHRSLFNLNRPEDLDEAAAIATHPRENS